MKKELTQTKSILLTIIIFLVYSVFLGFVFYQHGLGNGEQKGWNKGANEAFTATMDTVQAIMKHQVESDTSVTELVISNPDTITYYISRKTVLTPRNMNKY